MTGGGGRFNVVSAAGRIAAGYALMASLATGLAVALQASPPWWRSDNWLHLDPRVGTGASTALGLSLAATVVVANRWTVRRFDWAQRLHLDLRPLAQGLGFRHIVLLALFSSLGEELLFRGLLQHWLGVLPTAVLFGLCHQVPGPARWVWVTWATAVGLGFGCIFAATGSLAGPLVAHALINGVNFAFLRDHDPLAVR
ncbi:MAG: CPBP family intramembrane glutamic endopeptidase [Myxococcota bacterium]